MQKIFLAFPGYHVALPKKIKKVGDLEFWNLEKISSNEFIALIKQKIKPFNKNVAKNYIPLNSNQEFQESYKNSSWGMLLPNYTKDYLDGKYEGLFTVNLFSELSLPLMFYVQRMGVAVERRDIAVHAKAQFHGEDKKFANSRFAKFYKAIFPSVIGVRWQAYEVAKWTREDWRMNVACLLFGELAKYQRSKSVMTWQAECADIVSFYEALLSVHNNDNGKYKISQKLEILLGGIYGNKMPQIIEGVGKLFDARNDFVHGSFFDRLKRSTRTYSDNENMAQLPPVDFHFLETQSKIAKQVLTAYLYLKKYIQHAQRRTQTTVPKLIQSGIMDIHARAIVQEKAERILKLSSFRAIS